MPITLNGDTGILTPMYNGTISSNAVTPSVNMKSRIINGAMVIDQRNAGASVTPSIQYTLDRWVAVPTQASKFTVQQNAGSVTPPAGFTNYLGITSTSSYSVLSSDTFFVAQFIEGFNTADLDFGKSSAKTVTLSFWVRSSLTGTFGGALSNDFANRSYAFNYTISAANTWEQKSVTIVGDTSGTWVGATNGIGLQIRFGLGSGSTYSGTAGSWGSSNLVQPTGSVSVVGTNGATWYLTGVQLEVGSTATSFDYRPYGTELALCERYFEILGDTTVSQTLFADGTYGGSGINLIINYPYKVDKRVAPTVSTVQNTWTSANLSSTTPNLANSGLRNLLMYWQSAGAGRAYIFNNSGTYLIASAEL